MRTLPRIASNTREYALDHYLHLHQHERLILHAPYQRGHVWGVQRQQNLIRSIQMGLPFGAITLNNRDAATGYSGTDRGVVVVDGLQRLTTLIDFTRGEFSVPAKWWDDHHLTNPDQVGDITWDDLTEAARRKFFNTRVPAMETELATVEQERELFNLINFGGVPQGAAADLDMGA